jgi:hypothetical protein
MSESNFWGELGMFLWRESDKFRQTDICCTSLRTFPSVPSSDFVRFGYSRLRACLAGTSCCYYCHYYYYYYYCYYYYYYCYYN